MNPKTFRKSILNTQYQQEKKLLDKNILQDERGKSIELQETQSSNLSTPLLSDVNSSLKKGVNKSKIIKRVTKDDFTVIRVLTLLRFCLNCLFCFWKVLGRGSFGRVCLAQKKEDKKYYALKSLKKEDVLSKNQKNNAMSIRLTPLK